MNHVNGGVNYNRESSYGARNSHIIVIPFRYPFGTVATFKCKYGYALQGTTSSTCQNSTNWIKPPPTCQLSINIYFNYNVFNKLNVRFSQFLDLITLDTIFYMYLAIRQDEKCLCTCGYF